MFDIDSLKDKLDSETLGKLRAHVDDLTGQRDAARKESIDGRKKLKADMEAAQARVAALEDWAGIDAGADIAALPAPKGQGDAVKQLEAQLKRAQRERDEAVKAGESINQKYTEERRSRAVAQAVAAGGFHDAEAAELLISRHLEAQDDAFMFKTKDGKLIPLADGAKLIAAERPHLVKAPQGTGSGWRDAGGKNGGKPTLARSVFEALGPVERAAAIKEGAVLTD